MSTGMLGVIPARLESSRFHGKVLHSYQGKPLLYYLWRRVSRSKRLDRVVIATDNAEIMAAVKVFGGETILTSKKHRTGSDRVAEVASKLDAKTIVNIQADTLGLDPNLLDRLVDLTVDSPKADCCTIVRPIVAVAELSNPDVVKVIVSPDGRARWFSRFPLPFLQHATDKEPTVQFSFWAHVGIYAFRKPALDKFASCRRSPCEKAESLEQLRILENDGVIRVLKTKKRVASIDRREDLGKMKDLI